MNKAIFIASTLLTSLSLQAQTLVTFFTSEGNFEVEIYDDVAPITGDNFLDLVGDKYYDGLLFHRVIDGFMIQSGDPTATGNGGPGYTIVDEFSPNLSNLKKTISMANKGPNTGGSQFFINLDNNTFLDHDKSPLTSKHPVFGIVTENFNIVQNIGNFETDDFERPITDVVLDSIRVGSLTILSLPEANGFVEMGIVPNPTNTNSNLIIKSESSEPVTIQITDVLGRIITKTKVNITKGLNTIELSLIKDKILASGHYTLTISNSKQSSKSIHFIEQ